LRIKESRAAWKFSIASSHYTARNPVSLKFATKIAFIPAKLAIARTKRL
jgi:hypothetical protein